MKKWFTNKQQTWNQFCVRQLILDKGLPLSVVNKKNSFHFLAGSIRNKFIVRSAILCSLFFLSIRDLSGLKLYRHCAL